MRLKHLAVLAALVSTVTLGTVSSTLAAGGTPVATPVSPRQTEVAGRQTEVAGRQTEVATRATEALADRKAREERRVTMRIDVLNRLVARLQSDSRLSASDKALLLAEDQDAIAKLNAWKTKIAGYTTIAQFEADANVLASYHVLDVLVPQNRELIMVDNLQATSTKLGKSLSELQTKVNALPTGTANLAAMQTLLGDASSKLQTINGQLAGDQSKLAAMTLATANPGATFSQVKQDLTSVRQEFKDIREDFRKVKELRPTPTAKSTATVTPSPTATP